MTIGARVHWLLVLLAALIGTTAFASTDDLGLSVLLSAGIGLSALVAAAMLLLRLPGGGVLVAAAAISVITVQFIDLNALGLGHDGGSLLVLGMRDARTRLRISEESDQIRHFGVFDFSPPATPSAIT